MMEHYFLTLDIDDLHMPLQPSKFDRHPKPSPIFLCLWRLGYLSLLGLISPFVHAQTDLADIHALMNKAVQTHPLVGSARAEQRAAQEGVNAAKFNILPTPTLRSGIDDTEGMVSQASIRQPLWTGGKITANINQAIYDDESAKVFIAERQNMVAKNTIDIWQSYIYAVSLQQLYASSLKRLADFEAMMERRVQQGISANIELDLVKNRILQDQNAFQGALQQQKVAEARLSQMLGEDLQELPARLVSLDAMSKYVRQQSKSFADKAFSQIGLNHPSVIKQQYQVESAKQQVKAQQASRYPLVYAQYDYQFFHKSSQSDDKFSLGLNYEPGAGLSNVALTKASQARVQSLIESQEATRRSVMEEIQTQYQQFVSAKDRELSLRAAVSGAQIVMDSYSRQFIAGRKSWLEVLNAVKEHTQYQQQLLETQSQMLAIFYKLQVDFGELSWQEKRNFDHQTPTFDPKIAMKNWVTHQSQQLKALPKNLKTQIQPMIKTQDLPSSKTTTPKATNKLLDKSTSKPQKATNSHKAMTPVYIP